MTAAHPPRVDAHQHYWRYDAQEYGWIDDTMAVLRRDYLPEEVRPPMTEAGFDQAVAVQARQTVEETRFLLGLAGTHPFIAGVVGWVDLRAPDVGDQLRALAHPKLVGIRHIAQAEPDPRFLLGEAFAHGIAALAALDLAYDILVYPRQLPAAAELVRRFPGQRFVLDHLAKPDIRKGEIGGWARALRPLADAPNVMAKVSGLVTEARWDAWTPDELRPYLDVAFELFGPDRLMVGSDWPVCTVAGDYTRVMAVVTAYLAGRPQGERDAVLGGNARRFWKLDREERQP